MAEVVISNGDYITLINLIEDVLTNRKNFWSGQSTLEWDLIWFV